MSPPTLKDTVVKQPAIEVNGVEVIYKTSGRADDDVVALQNTSLRVGPHEFVSLLGPSGCGKTTLMKVMGGLLVPNEGTVQVYGRSAAEALEQRAFGMVFQKPNLLPWRRVLGNAALLLEITGRSKAEMPRVKELLNQVGLGDFMHRYPDELSGGMQQRVGIVRALSLDPKVLLMDEPFAAVDALTRDRMAELLLSVWGQTRPVVFITHSIEEAVFLSDRVVVMTARPGRVLEEVEIDLPRPRTSEIRESPEFNALKRRIRTTVDRAQD